MHAPYLVFPICSHEHVCMLWMKLLERHDCEYITSQHRGHVLPKIELLQCGCQRAASCRLDFTCHAGLTCCNVQCNAREQLTQVSFESFAAGQPCTQPCCGMFSICAIGMTREAMQAVTDNWVARQCFHYTNVCQASSLTVTDVETLSAVSKRSEFKTFC